MSVKKIIALIAGLAITVIAGRLLYVILTYGAIDVTSSERGAEIFLFEGEVQAESKEKEIGTGTTRVKPGVYTVELRSGDKRTRKVVEVARRETSRITLAARDTSSVNEFAAYSATGLKVDASGVTFLNVPQLQMSRIETGKKRAQRYLPDLYPLVAVYWASGDQAILEYEDGRLEHLDGTNALPLATPNGEPSSEIESISVSEGGWLAYILRLGVYAQPVASGAQATQVGEAALEGTTVGVANDGSVALFEGDPESSENEGKGNIGLVLTSPSGERTEAVPPTETVSRVEWSPDSKRIFYLASSGGWLFDVAEGTKARATSGATIVSHLVWTDNDTVVLLAEQELWSYNVSEQALYKLATLPTSQIASIVKSRAAEELFVAQAAEGGFGSTGKLLKITL